jgi:hypothetical protein
MSSNPDSILVSREIDDMLLQARGLALVRPILAERGASQEELDAHARELARVRHRLAQLVDGDVAA